MIEKVDDWTIGFVARCLSKSTQKIAPRVLAKKIKEHSVPGCPYRVFLHTCRRLGWPSITQEEQLKRRGLWKILLFPQVTVMVVARKVYNVLGGAEFHHHTSTPKLVGAINAVVGDCKVIEYEGEAANPMDPLTTEVERQVKTQLACKTPTVGTLVQAVGNAALKEGLENGMRFLLFSYCVSYLNRSFWPTVGLAGLVHLVYVSALADKKIEELASIEPPKDYADNPISPVLGNLNKSIKQILQPTNENWQNALKKAVEQLDRPLYPFPKFNRSPLLKPVPEKTIQENESSSEEQQLSIPLSSKRAKKKSLSEITDERKQIYNHNLQPAEEGGDTKALSHLSKWVGLYIQSLQLGSPDVFEHEKTKLIQRIEKRKKRPVYKQCKEQLDALIEEVKNSRLDTPHGF